VKGLKMPAKKAAKKTAKKTAKKAPEAKQLPRRTLKPGRGLSRAAKRRRGLI